MASAAHAATMAFVTEGRGRHSRAGLLHDGLTAHDIEVVGQGISAGAVRRIKLVSTTTS
jgi:hypothetical protein